MATLVFSDLRGISAEERKARIAEFVNQVNTPDPAALADRRRSLEVRCRQFERRFGMKIATLRELLDEGRVEETADYCTWLLLEQELTGLACP